MIRTLNIIVRNIKKYHFTDMLWTYWHVYTINAKQNLKEKCMETYFMKATTLLMNLAQQVHNWNLATKKKSAQLVNTF